MTLEQLKHILENKQPITQKYFIFECSTESSQFVFHQYLNLYCVNNNLNINFIDELTANNNVNLFTTTNTSVDVLYTDKLTSSVIPSRITWVRCKSIDKNLLPDISNKIPEQNKVEIVDEEELKRKEEIKKYKIAEQIAKTDQMKAVHSVNSIKKLLEREGLDKLKDQPPLKITVVKENPIANMDECQTNKLPFLHSLPLV